MLISCSLYYWDYWTGVAILSSSLLETSTLPPTKAVLVYICTTGVQGFPLCTFWSAPVILCLFIINTLSKGISVYGFSLHFSHDQRNEVIK